MRTSRETTPERDAAKVEEFEAKLEPVTESYDVLAADGHVLRAWARLMHGREDRLIEDALIAATAVVHNLTVVTRNVRDFARLEVATLGPFAARRR